MWRRASRRGGVTPCDPSVRGFALRDKRCCRQGGLQSRRWSPGGPLRVGRGPGVSQRSGAAGPLDAGALGIKFILETLPKVAGGGGGGASVAGAA